MLSVDIETILQLHYVDSKCVFAGFELVWSASKERLYNGNN